MCYLISMEICGITTDLWEYLSSSDKPLALYGTGDGADKIIAALKSKGLFKRIRAVFASDGFVRDRSFAGFKVRSYFDVASEFGEDGFIALLCFGTSRPDVLGTIRGIAQKTELYAPDVPVCGDGLFDMEYYMANKPRLEKVYGLLEDEASRACFADALSFKLTGDLRYLDSSVSHEDEEYGLLPDIDGAFIDLGAYNGDTLTRYLLHYPNITSACAVEPERHSYKKLCRAADELKDKTGKRIDLYNALIGDRDGKATLTSSHGRGTRNADVSGSGAGITAPSGMTIIDKVTIDRISESLGRAGFIKFDVEGEECAALSGGMRTITKDRPALKIACYHRNCDLFAIPEKVLSTGVPYKIYLRRLQGVPCWDLDYYFV